ASVDPICEDNAQPNAQGGVCQAEAGTVGDGNVTISFDWGGADTFSGCPNPAGQPGVGRNYAIVVDNNLKNALISVGYSIELAQYAADLAHPGILPDSLAPAFHCGDPASDVIRLLSSNTQGGQITAQVHLLAP